MRNAPPEYWCVFVRRFLHASPQVTEQLWRAFQADCSTAVRWQLDLCSISPTVERQQKMLILLPPKDLLEAAERLIRPGTRRHKEVIDLEERILVCTNAAGGWR